MILQYKELGMVMMLDRAFCTYNEQVLEVVASSSILSLAMQNQIFLCKKFKRSIYNSIIVHNARWEC
jgi:hypothetical protein